MVAAGTGRPIFDELEKGFSLGDDFEDFGGSNKRHPKLFLNGGTR